ncbi:MAG: glycosyltransferase family 39 protein [Planctomycetes bacterium]|nr:glycosyltransferase family 39 protein [Planctomycetota bacterium]
MSDGTPENSGLAGGLSGRALIAMSAVCGFLCLAIFTGDLRIALAVILNGIMELSAAIMILVAAGGYGHLAVGRLIPRDAQASLRAITACGAGLSLLAAAVLVAGTFIGGLQNRWLWWLVIIAGAFLAVFQGRKSLHLLRPSGQTDGRSLVWLVLAAAIGIWLAGVMRMPASLGVPEGDAYDILEYHLQVPREYYDAGRITELRHNCYSYYPMGVEMLFLLAMSLRGGPFDGAYLAQVMHGMFGVLAAATLLLGLRKDDDGRARFSAGLLATTPAILYLGWLAMSELAMVFYLAVAAVWLRQWLKTGQIGAAACIGLMAGCACATKYLAILFVAAPLLAVMLPAAILSKKKILGLAFGVVLGCLPAAPWLVRNAALTGNPVFPLATKIFGAGHWSAESAQRWDDGHGPQDKPPVPIPPAWKTPPGNTQLDCFIQNFLSPEKPYLGLLTIILAGLGICAMIASTKETFDPWELCLAGILAVQLVLWIFMTHQMPWRFIVPATVPLSLLAGGVLKKLAGAKLDWFRRKTPDGQSSQPAAQPPGRMLAVAIFMSVALTSAIASYNIMGYSSRGLSSPPLSIRELAEKGWQLQEGKWLLIGDSNVYYFKPGTVYATVFDAQLLDEMIRKGHEPARIVEELRAMGITHIDANWIRIWWMARTYGFPASLSTELFDRSLAGENPGLKILDAMRPFGLEAVDEIPQPARQSPQPETAAAPAASQSASGPTGNDDQRTARPFRYPYNWPMATIYKLAPAANASPVPASRPK